MRQACNPRAGRPGQEDSTVGVNLAYTLVIYLKTMVGKEGGIGERRGSRKAGRQEENHTKLKKKKKADTPFLL